LVTATPTTTGCSASSSRGSSTSIPSASRPSTVTVASAWSPAAALGVRASIAITARVITVSALRTGNERGHPSA
jgi:hypothetical protein